MYLWVGDLKTDLKTDFNAEKGGEKIPVLLTCFHCSPFTDFFFFPYTRTSKGYVRDFARKS